MIAYRIVFLTFYFYCLERKDGICRKDGLNRLGFWGWILLRYIFLRLLPALRRFSRLRSVDSLLVNDFLLLNVREKCSSSSVSVLNLTGILGESLV